MADKIGSKTYFLLMCVLIYPCVFYTVECEHCSISEPMDILETNGTCDNTGEVIITSKNNGNHASLNASNRCLSALPKNLCDFKNIEAIHLKRNNIENISDISCLYNLKTLDLSYNKIQELKTGVFDNLVNLVTLNLSNNRIHTIELGVFHSRFDCLERVYLDSNNLTYVDTWTFNMSKTYHLFSLKHNQITHLTNRANFKFDPNESYIGAHVDLQFNELSVWNYTVFKSLATDLVELGSALMNYYIDLRNNPWHCDCNFHKTLDLLGKTSDFFKTFSIFNISCYSPPDLSGKAILDIDRSKLVCNVTHQCPSSCICQDQPHFDRMLIDCSGVKLLEMPRVLPEHHRLTLHFQNNTILHLPDLAYANHISYLNLSNNNLCTISASFFESSHHLTNMDLSNNNLQHLPESIQKFSGVEMIISNNPLVCTCSDTWFWQWFQSQSNMKHKESITCSTSKGVHLLLDKVNSDVLKCGVHNHEIIIVMMIIFSLITVLIIGCCVYFRYEILTIYHLRISPMMRNLRKRRFITRHDIDVFVMLNNDDDEDRRWVNTCMIPYLRDRNRTSFIPFRDALPGDVTAETNLSKIHTSSFVVAFVSPAFLDDSNCMHELSEAYCYMVKGGNGKLLLIRHKDIKISKVNEAYIRSMLRVGNSINANEPALYSRIDAMIM